MARVAAYVEKAVGEDGGAEYCLLIGRHRWHKVLSCGRGEEQLRRGWEEYQISEYTRAKAALRHEMPSAITVMANEASASAAPTVSIIATTETTASVVEGRNARERAVDFARVSTFMPGFIERELEAGMRAENGLPPQESPERDGATQPPPAEPAIPPLPEKTPEAELLPLAEDWYKGAVGSSAFDIGIGEEVPRGITLSDKPNHMNGVDEWVVGVLSETVFVAPATPATDWTADAVPPSPAPLATGKAVGNWRSWGKKWEKGGHITLCPYVTVRGCKTNRPKGSSCARRHVNEAEMLSVIKQSKEVQKLGSIVCNPSHKNYDSTNCELWRGAKRNGDRCAFILHHSSAFMTRLRAVAYQEWQNSVWKKLKRLPGVTKLSAVGCQGVCQQFNGVSYSCKPKKTASGCLLFHDPKLTEIAEELNLPPMRRTNSTACNDFANGHCENGDSCIWPHVPPGKQLCSSKCHRWRVPGCKAWHDPQIQRWHAYNAMVRGRAKEATLLIKRASETQPRSNDHATPTLHPDAAIGSEMRLGVLDEVGDGADAGASETAAVAVATSQAELTVMATDPSERFRRDGGVWGSHGCRGSGASREAASTLGGPWDGSRDGVEHKRPQEERSSGLMTQSFARRNVKPPPELERRHSSGAGEGRRDAMGRRGWEGSAYRHAASAGSMEGEKERERERRESNERRMRVSAGGNFRVGCADGGDGQSIGGYALNPTHAFEPNLLSGRSARLTNRTGAASGSSAHPPSPLQRPTPPTDTRQTAASHRLRDSSRQGEGGAARMPPPLPATSSLPPSLPPPTPATAMATVAPAIERRTSGPMQIRKRMPVRSAQVILPSQEKKQQREKELQGSVIPTDPRLRLPNRAAAAMSAHATHLDTRSAAAAADRPPRDPRYGSTSCEYPAPSTPCHHAREVKRPGSSVEAVGEAHRGVTVNPPFSSALPCSVSTPSPKLPTTTSRDTAVASRVAELNPTAPKAVAESGSTKIAVSAHIRRNEENRSSSAPVHPPNELVCLFCDDGGEILLCDGMCGRSFCSQHNCMDKFGLPPQLWYAFEEHRTPFHCPNCFFKRHNCFACGKLGDLGTDVFQCSHSKCAKFYHPHCLERQGVRVTKGTFICPCHTCAGCKSAETEPGNPLVPCRRCPTAFHEHCIPPVLAAQPGPQRVWLSQDGQVPESLIFCDMHLIPEGHDIPPHNMVHFTEGMRRRWLLSVAFKFPTYKESAAVQWQYGTTAAQRARRASNGGANGVASASPPPSVSVLPRKTLQTSQGSSEDATVPLRAKRPRAGSSMDEDDLSLCNRLSRRTGADRSSPVAPQITPTGTLKRLRKMG